MGFDIRHFMRDPPHPLSPIFEVDCAREVEMLLAKIYDSASVRTVLKALMADVEPDSSKPRKGSKLTLPIRNFVLLRLARVLGPQNVQSFIRCYLDPRRFDP